MKIACVSDLHGYLPEIPPCDLLLVGGDLCPILDHSIAFQSKWLGGQFRRWLDKLSCPIVGVAGNHDFVFQDDPDAVPELPWTYLQDSSVAMLGMKVHGSPHTPYFYDWAFNLYEPDLEKKWDLIPADTDILLLHGPPHGYGDLTPDGVHTGSPGLLRKIEEVRPKLAVAGHIHGGYGVYRLGETVFVNASHVNERYRPTNAPVIVDLSA